MLLTGRSLSLKLYLDTANPAEWQASPGLPTLQGVTTNPSLIHKAGFPVNLATYLHLIQEAGRKRLPEIMLQLPRPDPEEAKDWLNALLPAAAEAKTRLIVKLPCRDDWSETLEAVQRYGVPLLLTGPSNPLQLLWARAQGAQYVAPYLGRIENSGRDALALARACVALQRDGTQLVAASIKTQELLTELLAMGAYAVTLNPDFVAGLARDPLTDAAIIQFDADTQASQSHPAPR